MHLHLLQGVLTLCFAKVTKLLKLQIPEEDADALKHVGGLTIYIYIYMCVCVCVCCAFVGLDNKLYNCT